MKAIPIILAAAVTAVTLGIASPASADWRDNDWYRWHHHHHHYWRVPDYDRYYYVPPRPYYPPPTYYYYRNW